MRFPRWASSAMEAAKETKFGTKVTKGMRMMPKPQYTHSAEKACDTTLNEEKYCSQHNTLLYNITKPT